MSDDVSEDRPQHHDLNILLLVDVELNNVALSKFPQENFHEIFNMNRYILTVCKTTQDKTRQDKMIYLTQFSFTRHIG